MAHTLWVLHPKLPSYSDCLSIDYDLIVNPALTTSVTLNTLRSYSEYWYGGNWPQSPNGKGDLVNHDCSAHQLSETPRSTTLAREYILYPPNVQLNEALLFISPQKPGG